MKNYILVILLCFCVQIQAQEIKEYTCEELEDFAIEICELATRLTRGDSISKAGELIENRFYYSLVLQEKTPITKSL